MIKAINKKYQVTIDRFLKWDAKYAQIVGATDDNGGRAQEQAYDNAATLLDSLPKRERTNLGKHYDLCGY